MPYQYGCQSGDYGLPQGYGQAPQPPMYQRSQTQYPPPQPIVVVPQQPRHVVQQTPQFQSTSPHPYQPAQPQYYQRSPAQYQQGFHPPYQSSPPPQQAGSRAHVIQQPQQYQAHFDQPRPSPGLHQQHQGRAQPPSQYPPGQHQRQPIPQQQQPRPQQRSALQQAPPRPQASSQHRQPPAAFPSGPPPRVHQTSGIPQPRPVTQSTPQQRAVAHVQIPSHKPAVAPVEPAMPRSPKRRKSNEGSAIPVCNAPIPQKPSNQKMAEIKPTVQVPNAQQRIHHASRNTSSPPTELPSSQLPPTPTPNVDYQAVLLHLSDEFVTAAYSISPQLLASDAPDELLDQYQELMATAMGCLESAIKNYRQIDPRKEARIRLRLASLLHEETENSMEAEEVLSKGISLCERNKLTDLKYSMHHLLARIMHQSSPKAALKSVEKLVAETEALKLVQWTYAFRFLHVALALQMEASDNASLFKHLAAITASSEHHRHIAVQIVASAMEAMVHLGSGSKEAADHAQRALATARTHQLGQEMQQMPQMRVLLDCLDLACAMVDSNPSQVEAKLRQMHVTLDANKTAGWSTDGSFYVTLGPSSNSEIKADSAGLFRRTTDSDTVLKLQWLSVSQVYAMGFALSAAASMHKNAETGTAEGHLQEGLKMLGKCKIDLKHSLTASAARADWQSSLGIFLRIQHAFARCSSSDWASAQAKLHDLRLNFTEAELTADDTTAATLTYLEAVCKHAAGDLEAALALYPSPELAFQTSQKHTDALRDIQVLASINSIVILRAVEVDANQSTSNDVLAAIESYCLPHSNRALAAAWHTLKATSEPDMPIIKTKQYLQSAVKAGQAAVNQRLLCVIMNTMTHMYFGNIVGEQAEKSAKAGRSLALKTKDKLWLAVADRMYAKTLDLCGKNEDAKLARHEAEEAMAAVPEKIKQRLEEMEM